jgi:hypothetical protein
VDIILGLGLGCLTRNNAEDSLASPYITIKQCADIIWIVMSVRIAYIKPLPCEYISSPSTIHVEKATRNRAIHSLSSAYNGVDALARRCERPTELMEGIL